MEKATDTSVDMVQLRRRLEAGLAARGLSRRQASLAAGLGPGYVHSILREGKEPTVTSLARVCAAAGLSLSYVLLGLEISPQTERLMQRLEAQPDKRDSLLNLLG